MKYINYILVALLLSCHLTYAQPPIADLRDQLNTKMSDSLRVDLYEKLCQHYLYINLDSSLYYAKQGLDFALKEEYRMGQGVMQLGFASVYEKHNQLKPAQDHAKEALAIFEDIKYTNGLAGANNLMGVVLGKKGQLGEATEHFLRSLKLYEEIKSTGGIIQTYIKLGLVNDLSGNLDKSLEYYIKAQELNKGRPVSNANFALMNSIGIAYAKKGDVQRALSYFEEGVAQTDTPVYAGVHLALLGSMGNALQMLGREKEALAAQERVLLKARDFEVPEEEARALINLSVLYHSKEHNKSVQYLKNAIDITNRIEHKQLAADAWAQLAELEEDAGNYREALVARREYDKLSDTLYTVEKAREIAAMQAEYEVGKSQAQVEKLTLENQKRTFERNVFITALIFFLIFIVVLWRYYQYARRINAELQLANDIKNKLFSIIGHDLRAPMHSQLQLLELIQAGVLNKEEKAQMLQELSKNGTTTLDTLNSLLQWGKTQLKGIHLNKQQFDVKPMVARNIESLYMLAAGKQIAIADNVPVEAKLYADADQFDFVVRNLLANAIKFSHQSGTIQISAHEKGNTWVFAIKDEGVGMSGEQVKHVFDTALLAEGTQGEKGTGLGLMLSRDFVKANGGDIWVESTEGKGAVFYFSLNKA